jgi:hypothetical protein
VGHFEHAVALMKPDPGKAAEPLRMALRLAPAFVLAHVALAHLTIPIAAGLGRTTTLFLNHHSKSPREISHLRLLAHADAGEPHPDPVLEHLSTWPRDILAEALLDRTVGAEA